MINLNYTAQDAMEFERLALWMKSEGLLSETTVSKPKKEKKTEEKSEAEALWMRRANAKQLRRSKDEMERGLTLEEAALERLAAMDAENAPAFASTADDGFIPSPVSKGSIYGDDDDDGEVVL